MSSIADEVPNLGGTLLALKRQIPPSATYNSLALAVKDNVHILTTTSVATAKELFETNIVPSIDEAIKKFPNGKEVVNTVTEKVEELKAEMHTLEDEDNAPFNHKTGQIETDPERIKILKKLYMF